MFWAVLAHHGPETVVTIVMSYGACPVNQGSRDGRAAAAIYSLVIIALFCVTCVLQRGKTVVRTTSQLTCLVVGR